MKTLKHLCLWAMVATLSLALQSCSSDDGPRFSDIVVGTWVLDGYEVSGDDAQQGVEVSVDRLTIASDGRFTLYYPEGTSDSGTYEAGDDYIRLDYTDPRSGTLQRMLCEVMSSSEDAITLRYRDPDYDVEITVRLRRDSRR